MWLAADRLAKVFFALRVVLFHSQILRQWRINDQACWHFTVWMVVLDNKQLYASPRPVSLQECLSRSVGVRQTVTELCSFSETYTFCDLDTYLYTCVSASVCMPACAYNIYIYIIYIYMFTCTNVYLLSLHTPCMCVCICVCVYVCVRVCVQVRVSTRTH